MDGPPGARQSARGDSAGRGHSNRQHQPPHRQHQPRHCQHRPRHCQQRRLARTDSVVASTSHGTASTTTASTSHGTASSGHGTASSVVSSTNSSTSQQRPGSAGCRLSARHRPLCRSRQHRFVDTPPPPSAPLALLAAQPPSRVESTLHTVSKGSGFVQAGGGRRGARAIRRRTGSNGSKRQARKNTSHCCGRGGVLGW